MTIQDQAKQLKKDIKQFVNGGYVWISKIKAQKWTGGGEYYKVAFQTTAKDSKNEDLITLQSLILPEGWVAYWTGYRIELYKRVGEGELQLDDIRYNRESKLEFTQLQ